MNRVDVEVDSELRVDMDALGEDLVEQIFDELTIPNYAKQKAERMRRWGWWDLPDDFFLAEMNGESLIMPRGYALQLKLLLRENGMKVRWVDYRTWRRGKPFQWTRRFTPRKHQVPAVRLMRRHQQGIYEAPTGSGKSLTAIKLIHDLSPEKSIILVDKIELFNQWSDDIEDWLGIRCGRIGNGKWTEGRITVATVQTLWKALKDRKVSREWFEQWSCVIVDECHHVTAVTLQEVVGLFTARIREGVSATPDREDGKFEIALNILGEVFYKDDQDELRKQGVLVKPHVEAINTNFDFTYWGDHEVDHDEGCDVPGCKKIGTRHAHQNNYQDLKSALVGDYARNIRVCAAVFSQCGERHHHLIVSDEVRQLEEIGTILTSKKAVEALDEIDGRELPPIFLLTGRVPKARRKRMVREIKNADDAIILSTVAKEGLDIPAIDRIYIPFPSASGRKVEQWIGRGTRVRKGKRETIIFDFVDINVGVLLKQFKKRVHNCYLKLGLEIKR